MSKWINTRWPLEVTGKCRSIHSDDGRTLIGKRRTLIYYKGNHQRSKKTNWIMHEYYLDLTTHARVSSLDTKLGDWVLCKIYNNNKNFIKSYTKEDAQWLEPYLRKESTQMTHSSQYHPQPQSQLESHSMDMIQLDNSHSLEISHASPRPPSFYEIINKMTHSSQTDSQDQSQLQRNNMDPIQFNNPHSSEISQSSASPSSFNEINNGTSSSDDV
ncbi:NAC domain-containing protein 20-like [Prosopis cineraria]|uniref:NAC domain-containing protein 20-like n=1 Tax=Prosopis cineraria TaxID=364024 RepID=UPI00240F9652|nr:NAC domain-containing protein 20-like [Prosopis cineraria]